jgi:predicted ATPase
VDGSPPLPPVTETLADVTYLFSDVEGSTRLWEVEPERIGPALARHDALAREAVVRHGGRVVKMTGDGLHAAFDDPGAALAAAIDVQLAVAHPPEGILPLALRCGLHLGADQRRDGDYFGPAVNRAARVMSAAHGGQMLLTQAVVDRLAGRLPAGLSLRDLGVVRLRDLTSPERVHQLVHPRLRSAFPPLRSLASTPNNLTQQLNSFIGRERELAEVRKLLGQHRLVTVLAMGGIGKSRLSVQLGAEVLDGYPDGVWLVELAPLTDPSAVPQAIASVLGVREDAGGSITEALLRFVRDRTLLLILDNCEHLVEASADLAKRLLQAGPGVSILATSRDALQVAGEYSYHLQTLAVPDAQVAAGPEALSQHEAVRLFIERACAAQPAFRLTPANAASVAAICRQLDGIPLALELAAARTRSLPVDAIAVRLDDRFRLLTTQDRTVLPRQRTLRALIDWSYDMLPAPERALFERLSMFAGGWTLEAAEAVGAGGSIDRLEVVDLLARLVEKSLVTIEVESSRYRMLDTVRQYAADKLAQSGDEPATRERHLAHFAALVDAARPHLLGPEQGTWMARLDQEWENLLAAHAACEFSPTGAEEDLKLVFALKFYWLSRGLLGTGLRITLEALARPGVERHDLARCRGLADAGQICYFMGRYDEARRYLRESLAIARSGDQPTRLLPLLHILSNVEAALGNTSQALRSCDEALELSVAVGNRRSHAAVVNSKGQILRLQGDLKGAAAQYRESRAIAEEIGDHEVRAVALLNLAMVAIAECELGEAEELLRLVLQISESTKSRSAGQCLLDVCASLAAAREEWPASARFSGTAEAQAEQTGIRRDPADQRFFDSMNAKVQATLGQRAAALAAEGRALSYESAIAMARKFLAATKPIRS